jgi:uncharacterized repeat protein (TIGR04138 family)
MQSSNFSEVLDLIRQEDARFERNAYYFVRQALDHTLKARGAASGEAPRHVSGPELLEGIRDYALEQYGPLALTVLRNWNIRECGDFGEIVFQLVDYGVLGKTEQDRREDFDGVYDFEEAFLHPFLPEKKQRALQSRRSRENKESEYETN